MLGFLKRQKLWVRVVCAGLCGALITLAVGLAFIQRAKYSYRKEALANLSANARILAQSIDNKSRDQRAQLKNMAQQPLITNPDASLQDKLAELSRYAERHGLVRAGITTPDGIAHTSDNGSYDASNRTWFQQSKEGKPALSTNLYDRLGTGGDIVVFSEPIKYEGRVIAVLFATQYTTQYLNTAQMQILQRVNKIVVIDKRGTLLAGVERGDDQTGFFSNVRPGTQPEAFTKFMNNIKRGESGSAPLTYENVDYETVYIPLKAQKGWFVLFAQGKAELDEATQHLFTPTYWWLFLSVLSAFIVFAGLEVSYYSYSAEKRERQRLLEENHLLPENPNILSRAAFVRDIDLYYPMMKPDELAVVIQLHLTSLAGYEDVFVASQVHGIRVALAEKAALLSNEHCRIAYAGQDVYLVFASGFSSRKECRDFVLRTQASIAGTLYYHDHEIRLDSRGGAKIYFKNDENARSGEALLECARFAVNQADANEPHSMAFYDYEMQVKRNMLNKLRDDLPSALKRDELCMLYQPIYDIHTSRIVGFESLVRWRHPELGIILPEDFLPIAAEINQLEATGKWAVTQVLKDAQALGSAETPISINISTVGLLKQDYIEFIVSKFIESKLPPHVFVLEISDSNIAAVSAQVQGAVDQIKSLGIDICLDDFGSRTCSAKYLTYVPADGVKVCDNFYRTTPLEKDDRLALAGLVRIAKEWGVPITAKKVVYEAQITELRSLGFDFVQGFLYSRPIPLEKALELPKTAHQEALDAEA